MVCTFFVGLTIVAHRQDFFWNFFIINRQTLHIGEPLIVLNPEIGGLRFVIVRRSEKGSVIFLSPLFAYCSMITLIICTNCTLSNQIQSSHLWILPPLKMISHCHIVLVLLFQIHNNPPPPEKESFKNCSPPIYELLYYEPFLLQYSCSWCHFFNQRNRVYLCNKKFCGPITYKKKKKKKRSGSVLVLVFFKVFQWSYYLRVFILWLSFQASTLASLPLPFFVLDEAICNQSPWCILPF